MGVSQEPTGAVRSADGEDLDFTSMPWIGVFAVARTCGEGKSKYGRFNYLNGFPVYKLVGRAIRHLGLWLLGDRSEPNLEHAAWNILDAIQELALRPQENARDLLSPGVTIGPEMARHLAEIAPGLAARRKAGEFDDAGHWKTEDLPEVKMLLAQRYPAPAPAESTLPPEWQPVSTNAQVYGVPLRTEIVFGPPKLLSDREYCVTYDDGTRAYFLKHDRIPAAELHDHPMHEPAHD